MDLDRLLDLPNGNILETLFRQPEIESDSAKIDSISTFSGLSFWGVLGELLDLLMDLVELMELDISAVEVLFEGFFRCSEEGDLFLLPNRPSRDVSLDFVECSLIDCFIKRSKSLLSSCSAKEVNDDGVFVSKEC